jgi:hypothetical protein
LVRFFLITVWLVLNALDLVTTLLGLHMGYREVNPLPAYILSAHGEFGLLLFKAASAAAIVPLIVVLGRRYPRTWWALGLGAVLVGVVVVSNFLLLAQ